MPTNIFQQMIPQGGFCPAYDEPSSALSFLNPCDYAGYDDWFRLMCSFHEAGGSFETFDQWSSGDPSAYGGQSDVLSHWKSIDPAGGITRKTLYRFAYERANWTWQRGGAVSSSPSVDFAKAGPEITSMTGLEQAAEFVRLNFRHGENVCVVVDSKPDDKNPQKLKPFGQGVTRERDSLVESLMAAASFEEVFPGFNPESGAWIVQNPTDGKGRSIEHLTSFRNALVECDDISLVDQLLRARFLELPYVTQTYSGGKSHHFIVRVDAEGEGQYRDRVQDLYELCNDNGLPPDPQCSNASRLTRLPGCMRSGQMQALGGTNQTPESFRHWVQRTRISAKRPAATVELPPIVPLDLVSPVKLAPVVIDGLLREGCRGILVAASKAGKTWLAIELAVAISCGEKWLGQQCIKGRVLYVNFELQPESARDRFMKVVDAMGVDTETVMSNVDVWNMRGYSAPLAELTQSICDRVRGGKYGMIILDPFYKMLDGDENSAEVISRFCRELEVIARESGSALMYTHHHSKGAQGAKNAMDRASGSGVFARDADLLVDMTELNVPEGRRLLDGIGDIPCFRVSFVIRDFPYKPDVNVFFKVPKHVVDLLGTLDDCLIDSPQARGGRAQGIKNKADKEDRVSTLAVKLKERLGANGNKPLPFVETAMEVMDVTDKTARRYLKDLPEGFAIVEDLNGKKLVQLA